MKPTDELSFFKLFRFSTKCPHVSNCSCEKHHETCLFKDHLSQPVGRLIDWLVGWLV